MTQQRLIIVSNRLPFQIHTKAGKADFAPSAGGLVSSLKSYLQKSDSGKTPTDEPTIWIGSADISENTFRQQFGKEHCRHEEFTLHPVFIPARIKDKHYNGFCNETIWPLFHYFPSYVKFKNDNYEQYRAANHLFAEKVAQVYMPGDTIWIHDYHLMLLPAMLRERIPDATIGFFLHIPFPSFELFRLFPNEWRKEILDGLLGADLVGFHTNDYLQHFAKSVEQILGYDNTLRIIRSHNRVIMTDVFPVSIDFEKFRHAIYDSDIFAERNAIRKKFSDAQLVISVDRLDYTKAIVNRLESYEMFLELYPGYKERISYLLVIVPSRDIIAKYNENKKSIEEMVSRINGRFGTINWTPVIYQYKSLTFKKLTGLYLAADVALITPIRDGMNLVAKEFVATRADKRGVLILSETAGAASELSESILVNPSDRQEIADALNLALSMSVEEQEYRIGMMQKRLRTYDVTKWVDDFMSSLNTSKKRQEIMDAKEMSIQTRDLIIQNYSKAHKRLILLDYDGTLVPLASLPHMAKPTEELLALLRTLAEEKQNTIVLISGRSVKELDGWFNGLPIHMVAEHGAFLKLKDTSWQQTVASEPNWKDSVMPLLSKFSDRCAGTFVEEKTLSLAWHYRNAEKGLGFLRSRELINCLTEISSYFDFQVIEGHKVIEIRTRGVDKGMAASVWFSNNDYDFLLALGDDKTDEDLFKAMPADCYSIRIGLVSSAARFNMESQKDAIHLLEKMVSTHRISKSS